MTHPLNSTLLAFLTAFTLTSPALASDMSMQFEFGAGDRIAEKQNEVMIEVMYHGKMGEWLGTHVMIAEVMAMETIGNSYFDGPWSVTGLDVDFTPVRFYQPWQKPIELAALPIAVSRDVHMMEDLTATIHVVQIARDFNVQENERFALLARLAASALGAKLVNYSEMMDHLGNESFRGFSPVKIAAQLEQSFQLNSRFSVSLGLQGEGDFAVGQSNTTTWQADYRAYGTFRATYAELFELFAQVGYMGEFDPGLKTPMSSMHAMPEAMLGVRVRFR